MANAIYCFNGHFIGTVQGVIRARSLAHYQAVMAQEGGEERQQAFCTTCGASNISACQHCQSPIELRAKYCGGCGKPFPWTETAILAAREYADELEALSPEEKITLKGTFEDLAADTARTSLAATRFRKLVQKAGPIAGAVLQKMIETVATEAAKKLMGL